MNALITGGAGFIGSHLAEYLLSHGHAVTIFDNLSSGRIENIARFADRVRFIRGDIRDRDALAKAAAGCELIFHQAAIVSVPYSVEHPQETHDVNIQGTLNVLLAAREAGVKRVVFACSAAVYGDRAPTPTAESVAPQPIAPYGVEKICGEYYLNVFYAQYGIETVSLRYFNVFGPRQDPSSAYSGVISIFVDRAIRGAPTTVFGDGQQFRDFVFIDNVVQANWLAATSPNAPGRCYNVGCGQQTSLNGLLTSLESISGKSIEREYVDARAGDIRESLADISRISSELNYQPQVAVEEGLRRLFEYEKTRFTG